MFEKALLNFKTTQYDDNVISKVAEIEKYHKSAARRARQFTETILHKANRCFGKGGWLQPADGLEISESP